MINTYIHGSPENKQELIVKPYGSNKFGHDFGGVFLSKERKMGHIGPGPQNWYYINLEDDQILDLSDLWHNISFENSAVKKVLHTFLDQNILNDEELFEKIWATICDRYNYYSQEFEEIEEILDGWTCQTIQGQIAKELGYLAVKLDDERGQVYLMPGPGVLQRFEEYE